MTMRKMRINRRYLDRHVDLTLTSLTGYYFNVNADRVECFGLLAR